MADNINLAPNLLLNFLQNTSSSIVLKFSGNFHDTCIYFLRILMYLFENHGGDDPIGFLVVLGSTTLSE